MRRRTPVALVAITTAIALTGLTGQAQARVTVSVAKAASATIKGTIAKPPVGGKVLAVLSNGYSAYGKIAGTKFTVKLPKVKGSTVKFSLHMVTAKQSYAGSVSFGKVAGKKTTWYGSVSVKNGATVSLPKITFSSTYGTVKMTGAAAKLKLSGPLKSVSKAGKPTGAGLLGLAPKRKASSKGVRAASVSALAESTATGPGDDLDGDGLPNSLDIDDDGDGFPDPVDQSAGVNGSAPTAKYDAFSSLGGGIGNGPSRVTSPVNYNFLRDRYPNESDLPDLMKELSLLDDANFTMNIRAVSPFFTETMGTYIKAAWVNCTGLAWCLAADLNQSDPTAFVSAPRLQPQGDGFTGSIWQWAYTKTPGSECNVHAMNSCESVLWSSFSMKDFLQKAIANGSPTVNSSHVGYVAAQPTDGFGLVDPYVLNGPPSGNDKGTNATGFDLAATISPRGYNKFLDNLKPGDVFTINALLSDGSTSSIAMTVAPYFVTIPAIIQFTPGGLAPIEVDYNSADTNCSQHHGNEDCRPGAEGNPFAVKPSNPTLSLTFWRPQRLRIAGSDDKIPGTEPFVDMGGLDYRIEVQGSGDGSPFFKCPNSSVSFSSSDGGTWSKVDKPQNAMSNEWDYMKDDSPDAQPSKDRTATVVIDFSKCDGMSTSANPQRVSVRLGAYSQPTFGGQRGSTLQTFYFVFQEPV